MSGKIGIELDKVVIRGDSDSVDIGMTNTTEVNIGTDLDMNSQAVLNVNEINGVPLTSSGASTNFLAEDGVYRVPAGSGGGFAGEELTYTDTTNKVIGPLNSAPTSPTSLHLFPEKSVIQMYTVDYTVRQVTGGSAPGYYVCISTTSTAPGGGSFVGGSNPGTGIDSVLVSGDKVRVSYPS